jgi:glycosyltransferase involved in cell wall biosynthesis
VPPVTVVTECLAAGCRNESETRLDGFPLLLDKHYTETNSGNILILRKVKCSWYLHTDRLCSEHTVLSFEWIFWVTKIKEMKCCEMFIFISVDKHVHILRRNCLLKQVIEGKIVGRTDVTGRWKRRRTQLLDALIYKKRENTGNWKSKNWIALCGELPVARQTTERMNETYVFYWATRNTLMYSVHE